MKLSTKTGNKNHQKSVTKDLEALVMYIWIKEI